MKISLMVAQGVHTGKMIPIASAKFLIGRDPQCNLRPASPAISKQHCGILVRDSKVFVQDYGSTNGTCVNGEQVAGEREVANGDQLKVGPLEFVVKIEAEAPLSPAKAAPAQSAAAAAAAKPVVAADTVVAEPAAEEDPDAAAAMLLAMDDSSDPTAEASIPEGSTVMDIPPVLGGTPAGKPEEKAPDTSKAARDLLSKYMRRPRT